MKNKKLKIKRINGTLGRFMSLKHGHKKEDENAKRGQQLKQSKKYYETDGINNLAYKLNMIVEYDDYIQITADLLPPKNTGAIHILSRMISRIFDSPFSP